MNSSTLYFFASRVIAMVALAFVQPLFNSVLVAQGTNQENTALLREKLKQAESNLDRLENERRLLEPRMKLEWKNFPVPDDKSIHTKPVNYETANQQAQDKGSLRNEDSIIKEAIAEKKDESENKAELSNGEQAGEKKADEKKDDEGKKEEETKADDKKKEEEKKEEKPKEWYEKIKVRGYTQFRYNYLTSLSGGSTRPDHAGDASISDDQELFIRRARVVVQGDISEHLSIYLQPDFSITPDNQVSANHFVQLRDWYADLHIDKTKIHRIRLGLSKIPYGWENLQSSQNRLYLDRNDAFNSAARNERDVGVFYYWTPAWAQETFKFIADEELKGSGNYGVFGFGAYDGQGGSLRERNDEMHLISRLTIPRTLCNGQIVEAGIQGYTGRYVVEGAPISPRGIGPAVAPIGTLGRPFGDDGKLDQRLGWTLIYYPQPLGFQAEYTIGRGPELNDAQTAIERQSLHGGYLMMNYRHFLPNGGQLWPFIRWQHYEGGYKSAINAPSSSINEWNVGAEWQIKKEFELVCEYLLTDRTSLRANSTGLSYGQFNGDVLRFQFQINY